MDVDFDAWVAARSAGLQRLAHLLDPSRDPEATAEVVTEALVGVARGWHRLADVDAAGWEARRRIVGSSAAGDRAAVVLHLHEELTLAEVADVLGWPERTVRTRIDEAVGVGGTEAIRDGFAAELSGFEPVPLQVAAPPPGRRRPRALLVAGLVGLVVLLAVGGWFAWRVATAGSPPKADVLGCPFTHRVQVDDQVRPDEPFLVERMAHVGRFVVCQYAVGDPTSPGLSASRILSVDESADLLSAIRAARSGGGPDLPPECTPPQVRRDVLVLRLHTVDGTFEAYVRTKLCRGNGIDDGTHVRVLTRENCAPLWAEGLTWTGAMPLVEEQCAP